MDLPSGDLILSSALTAGRRHQFRIKRIGFTQAPKGMPRLCEGVESCSGQNERIETKGVGRVSLGFCNCLTTGPHLCGICRRSNVTAYFSVAVYDCTPHTCAIKESANWPRTTRSLGGNQERPKLVFVGQALTIIWFVCERPIRR